MVGAALVDYAPGSVVTYNELLVSFLTREGRRLVSTLSHIWVDSPQSVAGGRELWAIPKGLAQFERVGDSATVDVEGRRAASLDARVGGPAAAGLAVVQPDHRPEARRPQRAGHQRRPRPLRRARIDWDFPADGPLAYMRAGRPLFSVELDRMGISFGLSCRRW